MKFVHIGARVSRRIESLKHSGKAGIVLAQKATRIIESLASGAIRHHMDAIGSYTRYGEKRIKNCRKYDLGCGYRLITLQRGLKAFIPFLGTHDECQRWLENNSRLKEVATGNGTLFRVSDKTQPPASPANADSADLEEDADNEVLLKLIDKDLRCVFCGLVETARKRPP
ncbi:MAG TPA: hypothetical protein HPQ03_02530 [Deltaproteobacteria bacterium]|nr:hypothetical protein [Deltaproteobacteria bacterium]